MDKKVSLTFLLFDGVSAGTRKIGDALKKVGHDGKSALEGLNSAGEKFDALVRGLQASMGKLSLARDLKNKLVDPLTKAAGDVQSAQKALAANLPQTAGLDGQVGTLTSAAMKTAGPTAFSTAQVLDLQTEFVKSGQDADTAAAEPVRRTLVGTWIRLK